MLWCTNLGKSAGFKGCFDFGQSISLATIKVSPNRRLANSSCIAATSSVSINQSIDELICGVVDFQLVRMLLMRMVLLTDDTLQCHNRHPPQSSKDVIERAHEVLRFDFRESSKCHLRQQMPEILFDQSPQLIECGWVRDSPISQLSPGDMDTDINLTGLWATNGGIVFHHPLVTKNCFEIPQ